MKKFGIVIIVIAIVATASIFFYNQSQAEEQKGFKDIRKGTLVKEQVEWTRYYT